MTGGGAASPPPRSCVASVLDGDCDVISSAADVTMRDRGDDGPARGQRSPTTATEATTMTEMTLTQYRVAWHEQMVLRMTHVPHDVVNSGYAATESTGGLPYLLDLSPPSSSSSSSSSSGGDDVEGRCGPALVGRDQPGGLGSRFFRQRMRDDDMATGDRNDDGGNDGKLSSSTFVRSSGSHIVDYLRCAKKRPSSRGGGNAVSGDPVRPPEQRDATTPSSHFSADCRDDAAAYEALIRDRLDYILAALRYGNDPAWDGIYRPQCVRASADPNDGASRRRRGGGSGPSFFPLWSWYQAYAERSLALRGLLPDGHATASFPSSGRGGLALELFRYNDHGGREHDGKKRGADHDDDGGGNPKNDNGPGEGGRADNEARDHHQHHPFSSYLSCRGGSGGGDAGRVNVRRAMEIADYYYASLERRLLESDPPPPPAADDDVANDTGRERREGRPVYLLGTDDPTPVDALLFAHIAEALCDVHLVLVLARRPVLVRYFSAMYDRYFGKGYADEWRRRHNPRGGGEDDDDGWIRRNDVANSNNAFNRIPEIAASRTKNRRTSPGPFGPSDDDDDDDDVVRAIQLMRRMSVHCNGDGLVSSLREAAADRTAGGGEGAVLGSYHRPMGPRLYRWIMGSDDVGVRGPGRRADGAAPSSRSSAGDGETNEDDDSDAGSRRTGGADEGKPSSKEDDEEQRKHRELVERMKRDRRVQDELWLSGVGLAIAVALVVSASRKSN